MEIARFSMTENLLSPTIPLSLYIHFPWCVRKCPYCDFNSHTLKADLPEDAYIDALLDDLTQHLPQIWGKRISSIFMGGGTPSLFSAQALDRLLAGIRALIPITANCEITLEANPGTVEAAKFAEFYSVGINRLSIGVQSFADEKLQALGRIHNGKEAHNAIESAQKAGFDNINIDLMHGLPKQSVSDALDDLQQAVKLKPSHLSWYHLTLEPNTVFYRYPPTLPVDETLWDIQQAGWDYLQTTDYRRYEVSAFSLTNKQCQHNLNYWQFGDYLGIGAGAHSKLTDINKHCVQRIQKVRQPQSYLDNIKNRIATTQRIDSKTLPLEFMMNVLRLVDGVPKRYFIERTGLPLSVIETACQQADQQRWLNNQQDKLQATEQGLQYLNELLLLFTD